MPSPAKTQQILEINLISAQGLKPPSSPRRRLQTYSIIWIDSSIKLRTRVDKIGGQNPTWNDKFLFRVTPEFLASDTAGVCVAIYAVGTFRDHLVGTVRFLISNILSSDADAAITPCFSAFQIRRSSGRFHGVMNIGAMVIEGSDFPALDKISAIGYRDLMGEKIRNRRRKTPEPKAEHADVADDVSSESCENSCTESVDEAESSTTSSSSSPRTTALKEWNGVRELAGRKGLTASGLLCCLVAERSVHHLSTSNPNMER
ncbi:uncharacterized protein LOC133306977 [Gastrolobium bilobum]|uniref:uncharacterized protein LOC133306977 n=1 Tax=Gastrolobium bilobum TaxID=150636 RepID=UPI002AB0E04C|nr:uncharacterized protein LOC133306977 [Gastrolobium bilobum]